PPADAPAPRQASGMRQMGLPYASEPAVSLHLLQFLRHAAGMAGQGQGLLYPRQVLFNGGSLKPAILRNRILDILKAWFPGEPCPEALPGADLSLAVAIGAAYYGKVRRGEGVAVRGGIARSYFIEAETAEGATRVCI